MLKIIIDELRSHTPFTILGAISGILVIVVFRNIPSSVALNIFYILHPLHVVLSALVTASMYSLYKCGCLKKKCNIWMLLVIGYVGSVGIATLSDSIIPFFGEILLRMPHSRTHIGFIEKWWLINPLAIIGIAIAYFKPSTKIPHSGHVLVSTWASLFHIIMARGENLSLFSCFVIFVFLFIAVWIPCCVSDIVFPLLFIKEKDIHKHSHH
ncbi:MAG: hypothetical protein ABIA97_00370 [Candidatus Omnitrophota bacterium]